MADGPNTVRTTVVVVTWRGRAHIAECLDALAAQQRQHRTLVVDNASDDGTAELLAAHPSRPDVLRLPSNRGYAGGLAASLDTVDTPFVAWLNDDAAPEPGWLAALEDALDTEPRAAAAAAVLVLPGGVVQSVGVALTESGHGADVTAAPESEEMFGFCGGAALLRTDALRAVGGVPSGFFCYYEDTDTAWRLRLAGWRVVAVAGARARHRHGASTRLGSTWFHRWNERNRLLTLLRCAPAGVAARELARFAAITALLPLRRLGAGHGTRAPHAANFRVRLRLRVLAEVAVRLPGCLLARHRISRSSTVRRHTVWAAATGRPAH